MAGTYMPHGTGSGLFNMTDHASASTSPKHWAVGAARKGESDDDDDGASPNAPSDTDSEGPTTEARESTTKARDEDELHDGMLPRDRPKRTAYYDPVAERQMSQTDAKLFYQTSQNELQKSGGGTWPAQASPLGSPATASATGPGYPIRGLQGSGSVAESPVLIETASSPSEARKRNISSGSHEAKLPPPLLPIPETWIPAPNTFTSPLGDVSGLGSMGYDSQVAGASAPPGQWPGAIFTDREPPEKSGGFFDARQHITAELSEISQNIDKIRMTRQKYIHLSLQRDGDNPKDAADWHIYPPPPEPAWAERDWTAAADGAQGSTGNSLSNSIVLPQEMTQHPLPGSVAGSPVRHKKPSKRRKPGQNIGEDFDICDLLPLPEASTMTFKLSDSGIYQVFDGEANGKIVDVPTIREFYMDLDDIVNISSDGPSKSFAFRRLQYLEGKFGLYVLLNEYQETADSKKVPHRDFYNVRKVDTHVHHSACMNQKHLLRFIKSKMKKFPDEVVLFRDGKHLTLAEVFESINLTAYDLSIDTLDMHAHTDSFHRFDKFNLKYNPIGESRLRTIFLKTDNFINGRYLAEITKEVISDLESSKYQMVEWRISIYGKSIEEWDKLAAWVIDNKLFSHNVRWLIQIPRLYDVYKATGLMDTFEQVVKNVFQPLFEVTKDPSSHPKLHVFLQRVIGFDSVDDESKVERRLFKKYPVPKDWDSKQNPPYSYWIYFLFANMTSLNYWRKQRGFNTFLLRPHCGEAGDSEHLAVALLCCHSISHGLLLRKVPLLQYVFYLEQIGIAMSPLSNNALFLAYERNPFHQYFKRGLNVSLSTDDPLQFAFTKEPLIEEYAVAAQIYKLSPVDMCELAKNSVKQSGYELAIKQQWLGPDFQVPGSAGNVMVKTNIPDRREEYRHQTLLEERNTLRQYIAFDMKKAGTDGAEANGSAIAGAAPFATPKMSGQAAPATGLFNQGQESPLAASGRELSNPLTDQETMGQTSKVTSPRILPESNWSTDSLRDLYMSGREPKMFPGVVTRRQRSGSTRQVEEQKPSTGAEVSPETIT